MLVNPSITSKFTGDTTIDLFAQPDLNRTDYELEPFTLGIPQVESLNEISESNNEIPVKKNDSLLLGNLRAISQVKIRPTPNSALLAQTNSPFDFRMLSTIRLYPARYQGVFGYLSDYSCYVLAAGLKDRYNNTTHKLVRRHYVENDYFDIIAQETQQNRILISFDRSWVLPAINQYIKNKESYEMDRPVILRERLATLAPVTDFLSGDVLARWKSVSEPHGTDLKLEDLRIYEFFDSAITTADGCPSKVYMIFAPLTVDEAEKLYLYLHRDIQLYTDVVAITMKDLPLPIAKDFQYLFPIELTFIQNFVSISTDQMSRDQLEHVYEFGELRFEFPRLDELTGAYGSYLISEALFFDFAIRWEQNTLYVGLCGYIQAQDIIENYASFLTDLQQQNPIYQELPDFKTAVYLSKISDIKCFYHRGKYYAVTPNQLSIPEGVNEVSETSEVNGANGANGANGVSETNGANGASEVNEVSKIEMLHPLLAVTRSSNREKALKYLKTLGYDISPNPIPYQNNISLGYRTYQLGNVSRTTYYYLSTHGEELAVHEINGPHVEDIRLRLEMLLRAGYFFTLRLKNITRGYPGFIPSDPPVSLGLSADPNVLPTQIDNIIRGSS